MPAAFDPKENPTAYRANLVADQKKERQALEAQQLADRIAGKGKLNKKELSALKQQQKLDRIKLKEDQLNIRPAKPQSGLSKFFLGEEGRNEQLSNFKPEQEANMQAQGEAGTENLLNRVNQAQNIPLGRFGQPAYGQANPVNLSQGIKSRVNQNYINEQSIADVLQNLQSAQAAQFQGGQNWGHTIGQGLSGLGQAATIAAPLAGPHAPVAAAGGVLAQLVGQGLQSYNYQEPQQPQDQSFQDILAQLGGGQNQLNFAPIRQQAIQEFNQQTVPSIAARFGAMGSRGGQRSSAFAQALGSAGQNLQSDLAAREQAANLQNFIANSNASTSQKQLALQLLQQQLGARQQQQLLGQGQQRLNLEATTGLGQLGLGQQRQNFAQQQQLDSLNQFLTEQGNRGRFENAHYGRQAGFLEEIGKGLLRGAEQGVNSSVKYAVNV